MPGRTLLPERTFSLERLLCMARQTFVYQIFALPVSCLPPLSSPRRLVPFLPSGWHVSLNYLTAFESPIKAQAYTKLYFPINRLCRFNN